MQLAKSLERKAPFHAVSSHNIHRPVFGEARSTRHVLSGGDESRHFGELFVGGVIVEYVRLAVSPADERVNAAFGRERRQGLCADSRLNCTQARDP